MRTWHGIGRAEPFQDPRPIVDLLRRPEAGFLWFFLRLYIGWQWLAAGWRKLYGDDSIGWVRDGEAGGRFVNAGDQILAFWQRAVELPSQGAMSRIGIPWYRDFLQYMIDHRWNGWFTYVIAWGEFLVGLALILGAFTMAAAFFGAAMSFNYVLAGSAGLAPLLLVGSLLLMLAWKTAGYVGLDRWLLPALGAPWQPGLMLHRQEVVRRRTRPAPPKRRLEPRPHGALLHAARRQRVT